jgi:hypothetical protein
MPTSNAVDPSSSVVGTTIAAIVTLLVCSGDKKVSTKDAFTLFENNTGWSNGKSTFTFSPMPILKLFQGGWAFLLAFTAPMWTLTGCKFWFLFVLFSLN